MGVIFARKKYISMETQTTITNPSVHSIGKTLAASLMAFDLPILIERMKRTPTWTIEDLHAEILFKSPARQVVLTALRAGTEIESYQSDHSVTFHVIEGKIKIHTHTGSITLGQGKMFLMQEKMKYSLTTGEDTVLLLTIAKDSL
jgi:quercetin dioxygenase-like cupin family protein